VIEERPGSSAVPGTEGGHHRLQRYGRMRLAEVITSPRSSWRERLPVKFVLAKRHSFAGPVFLRETGLGAYAPACAAKARDS